MSLVALAGTLASVQAQETTVKVGTARAISTGATLIAIERGYFKEFGIKIELEPINSSADVMPLLAQNHYQVVEGGISAGYFNALQKNLPITLAADRTSSPLGHNIMLRPDLKDQIKTIKDLKGKIIGSNGAGSVSTYETGKVLETVGLTIADVEIKILPFTQMGLALKNKALDATLLIPPFTYQTRDQGLGVMFIDPDDYVRPAPTALAVNLINTDWAKNNPQLVKNYYVAYLRGVRDYCNAYHGGSTRKEIIDLLVKSGTERRPEMLNVYTWQSRSADGRINVASLLDMQEWYRKNKFTTADFPGERLVDTTYIDYAVQKLGPFVRENKDSKLPGCR
ncbi:MAG TPA: ABC transporter substrate-binding protein [Xanthobacteraceae bacterium]